MLFPTDRLLTDDDLVSVLGLSRLTLRKWRSTGKLPYTRIGGAVRYEPAEMERFVNAGRVSAVSEPMAAGGHQ